MSFLKNMTPKHWVLAISIALIVVIAVAVLSLILIGTTDKEVDDEQVNGVITMTTVARGASIGLNGTGNVTVDWGDDSDPQTLEFKPNSEFRLEHQYSEKSLQHPRQITITGENITGLVCSDQGLTALDVSLNTALTHLDCNANQLTTLDLSKNTALKELDCSFNSLTALDLSKNTTLEYLSCYQNKLTSLDVSQNTAMTDLRCWGNKLTALDVSKNIALTTLYCAENQFTADALNALFKTLHDNDFEKTIYIGKNLGSADCDPSIAEAKGWKVEGFEDSHSTEPILTESESVSLVGNWSTVGWADGNETMRTLESYIESGLNIDDLNIPTMVIRADNTFRFNTSETHTTGNLIETSVNNYRTIGLHNDEYDSTSEEKSRLQYDTQSGLLKKTTLFGGVESHIFLRRQ